MEYRVETFLAGGTGPWAQELTLAERLNQIAAEGWVLVQLTRADSDEEHLYSYETIWSRPCVKHQKLNR